MNDPAKKSVLIVDDNDVSRFTLKHILASEYIIYLEGNAESAVETAEKHLPNIILLDIVMPKMDGYEVIAALKKSEKTKNIPIIFVTSLDKTEDELKGFSLGAVDYITKPFHANVVRMRVANQLKISEKMNEYKKDIFAEEQKVLDSGFMYLEEVKVGAEFNIGKYEELLKEYRRLLKQLRRATKLADKTTSNLHEDNLDLTDKVHYDMLTGIFNRRYMEEALKRIINTITRAGGGYLSVMMMDVDFFKKYNDTYGHAEGDNCLKAVAAALAETVTRADDFVARYGGEEFAVIMPNTDENGARLLAEKILEAVRGKNIPHEKNDAAPYVTISIGVTTGYIDNYRQDGLNYVKRADEALYTSKEKGRNQYNFINFEEEK